MKLILKHHDITVTIEKENEDLDINDCFEDLIIPALLGIGYHPDTVNSYLNNTKEDEDE